MSDEKKLGVELLEKVIKAVVKDIKLGAEIAKDGIGAEDIKHVPAVIDSIKEILDLISHSAEVAAEAKDIDASEIGVLLMDVWAGYQEVEKA